MDSDDAIISSALGAPASGRVNSDSLPAASQPSSAAAERSRQQATDTAQSTPNEGITFVGVLLQVCFVKLCEAEV